MADTYGPEDFDRTLRESNQARPDRPLSIYMHLPFCERLCLFCGCNVVINKNHEVSKPYLDRLKWEIDQAAPDWTRTGRSSNSTGRGTPTYQTAEQLEDLSSTRKSVFRSPPTRKSASRSTPGLRDPIISPF